MLKAVQILIGNVTKKRYFALLNGCVDRFI